MDKQKDLLPISKLRHTLPMLSDHSEQVLIIRPDELRFTG